MNTSRFRAILQEDNNPQLEPDEDYYRLSRMYETKYSPKQRHK